MDHQGDSSREHQIQILDVYIVDVLAHLEALLRHSHSLQRLLLQMRTEAPPPRPDARPQAEMRNRALELQRECSELAQLIEDLHEGVTVLTTQASDEPLSS